MGVNTDLTLIPLGDRSNRRQSIVLIPAQAAANKPGILVLQTTSGAGVVSDYYFWPNTSGVLRYGSSKPTAIDTDGAAVGAAASVTLDQAYDNGATIDGAISSATAIKLGGAGANDNVSIYHNATDLYFNVNAGDLIISIAGGDINFSNSRLATTGTLTVRGITNTVTAISSTAAINIGADSVNLTLGASGATDSYIQFDGTSLKFYDSDVGAVKTLRDLAGAGLSSPTITGDMTISDGKITWTDAVAENAGAWTFAGTTTSDITISSSITTGKVFAITANSATTGIILDLIATEATFTTGAYLRAYDNTAAAQVFAIKEDGEVEIAGASGSDMLTISAGNVQVDEGKVEIDTTQDITTYVKRNQAITTGPVVEIEETNTAADNSALLVDHNATGAVDAMQITHDGTGYGLSIIGTAAGGKQLLLQGPASQTASILVIDGTTGSWIGAATTGMVHLTSDGALVADGSLLRISSTGAISAANDGACLEVLESGAVQATSYAVRIASTNNEALHIDTGMSLFDENVAVTIADTQNQDALTITQSDSTNNKDAIVITTSGTGHVLKATVGTATGGGASFIGAASQTTSILDLDGSTNNWIGASNVGMLHLVNDGSLANVNASLLYIAYSGTPQANSLGTSLRINDSGVLAATSYAVYINATNNEALKVDAGESVFDEKATFSAGLLTMVATTDVANPPTSANMVTAFGAAATAGTGFVGIINDAGLDANNYLCFSNGTSWWYITATKGA